MKINGCCGLCGYLYKPSPKLSDPAPQQNVAIVHDDPVDDFVDHTVAPPQPEPVRAQQISIQTLQRYEFAKIQNFNPNAEFNPIPLLCTMHDPRASALEYTNYDDFVANNNNSLGVGQSRVAGRRDFFLVKVQNGQMSVISDIGTNNFGGPQVLSQAMYYFERLNGLEFALLKPDDLDIFSKQKSGSFLTDPSEEMAILAMPNEEKCIIIKEAGVPKMVKSLGIDFANLTSDVDSMKVNRESVQTTNSFAEAVRYFRTLLQDDLINQDVQARSLVWNKNRADNQFCGLQRLPGKSVPGFEHIYLSRDDGLIDYYRVHLPMWTSYPLDEKFSVRGHGRLSFNQCAYLKERGVIQITNPNTKFSVCEGPFPDNAEEAAGLRYQSEMLDRCKNMIICTPTALGNTYATALSLGKGFAQALDQKGGCSGKLMYLPSIEITDLPLPEGVSGPKPLSEEVCARLHFAKTYQKVGETKKISLIKLADALTNHSIERYCRYDHAFVKDPANNNYLAIASYGRQYYQDFLVLIRDKKAFPILDLCLQIPDEITREYDWLQYIKDYYDQPYDVRLMTATDNVKADRYLYGIKFPLQSMEIKISRAIRDKCHIFPLKPKDLDLLERSSYPLIAFFQSQPEKLCILEVKSTHEKVILVKKDGTVKMVKDLHRDVKTLTRDDAKIEIDLPKIETTEDLEEAKQYLQSIIPTETFRFEDVQDRSLVQVRRQGEFKGGLVKHVAGDLFRATTYLDDIDDDFYLVYLLNPDEPHKVDFYKVFCPDNGGPHLVIYHDPEYTFDQCNQLKKIGVFRIDSGDFSVVGEDFLTSEDKNKFKGLSFTEAIPPRLSIAVIRESRGLMGIFGYKYRLVLSLGNSLFQKLDGKCNQTTEVIYC